MENNKNKYFFIGAFALVFFDQLTKLLVKGFDFMGIHADGMILGSSFSFIGDFVRIAYVENKGMAFGIEFGWGKIFLSLFSIIASIGLVYYLHRLQKFSGWVRLGIMFILAGAVGNLVDRVFYGVFYDTAPLFYGAVVDFVMVDIPDISIGSLNYTHWPVWNIADACVSIGVVVLVIFHKRIPTMKEVFPKKQPESAQAEIQ